MLGGTSGTFSDSDSDEGGLRSGEITPSHNQAEAMSPDTLSGSGFGRRQNSVMSADALSESSRGQVDIMSTGTLSGSGCEPRKNDVMSTDAISESCGGTRGHHVHGRTVEVGIELSEYQLYTPQFRVTLRA